MISDKRLKASEYMTIPMYMVMKRKWKIFDVAYCIFMTLITLGISAAFTLFLNGFFEQATTALTKQAAFLMETFYNSHNIQDLISSVYKNSSNNFVDLAWMFITPFYLVAMFFNLTLSTLLVYFHLQTAFCAILENAEPYKYFNNAIEETKLNANL
ncbi:hypothetical protein OX90_11315 [Pseudomonas coronafaciens pv. porri]|uniref:Uncharacterized protein n=1 Tax=Pseudomonas coronafaciens pv. porri TaxID=83964 RepID=A0ABR5JPM8_9PSED|nr:hypothetical protein [Pseudomonas coronafaciens]KOP59464.1 hypothetical protein OX90_11315 [Pseudomonas coronafaciens pv. porri]